jgi:hypothetical protein
MPEHNVSCRCNKQGKRIHKRCWAEETEFANQRQEDGVETDEAGAAKTCSSESKSTSLKRSGPVADKK